jgi:cobalt-zinc-cadmium efflux system protein
VSTAHAHGHGHSHRPPADDHAAARYKGRLVAALAVLGVATVVEVVAGFATRSLALVSDAGHMLTDVGGLGMALAAIHVADRSSPRGRADRRGPGPSGRGAGNSRRSPSGPAPEAPRAGNNASLSAAQPPRTSERDSSAQPPSRGRTFGLYRLEILAALANALLLFGVAIYVLVEAVRRWNDPADVLALPMLVVAVVGLVANVVAFGLLREGSRNSLNVQGAYLEVLSDLLGSLGVILAAVVLQVTGWDWVDPAVGVAIGVFILPRAWRLGAQAVRILVQAAPLGTDLVAIEAELEAIEGVVDVHDLHVWTLTSEMDVASVHLMVRDGTDSHGVLDRARVVLRDGHGIGHATLQVEPDTHEGCDELAW